MSLSFAREALAVSLLLLACNASGRAISPDLKLVSLLPGSMQNIAGINPAPPENRHARFVVITRKNAKDMDDLQRLWGVDASRAIRQVIFAARRDPYSPEEHSLLVSGHFDQAHIYHSILSTGAAPTEYRGFRVVEIRSREKDAIPSDEVRWLAVLDASVLLFGTVGSVKQELDHWVLQDPPDMRLIRMLAQLRRGDDAWSLVLGANNGGIRDALTALSPELARLADGKSLLIGIHYGHKVEFEYAVEPYPGNDPGQVYDSAPDAAVPSMPGSISLFASLGFIRNGYGGEHGKMKVSKDVYDRWLNGVASREVEIRATTPRL